jgi:P4 family phage/plasmid primase-like protien
MYVETLQNYLTVKCRDSECFGKIYPCTHVYLTKQEMNVALYGNVSITINNSGNIDDLVDFQKMDIYENDKLNTLVFNSLNGKSSSLAEIVFYYCKDSYNYGEDNNWYVFEKHKWKNIGQKNSNLRYSIQPKLKETYDQLLSFYKKNDTNKTKMIVIKQIIKSFDDTVLKNNIITELIDLFLVNNNQNRDFVKTLDANTHLIGFNNGVYDLKELCFRDGKQSDHITMSVGYNYDEKHTKKYKDLQKFLNDIQPNKEEFDYAMTYLSIGLIGNMLELFTILSGCGRNGKSKLIELIKETFGDYFGSVGSQLFTRPRPNADSPDPGLLSLAKKKIVIASEPEKNSKLNSGFIKFITGRDSTTLRNCHQNEMIDFAPKFITFLICNDIPDCDDIDNAFSKRLRCINFPTEFVDNPTKENQKQINVDINENFKFWRMDFMLLMIEYYKKYIVTHTLKPTDNILKWTNQYKENTDMYLTYLNENTDESDEHVHCSMLYVNFKGWFKENNPNAKIPNNKEFVNGIRRYKTIEKVWAIGKGQLGIKNLKLINDD